MKAKKRAIIIVSVCLVLLFGAFIADRLLGKSYFNEIKYDELMKKIDNKEDLVLLISQTGCTHCISYKPNLKDVANKHKVNIYYIDVDLLDDDKSKELKKYISFSSTPITVFLKDGEEKTAANRIIGYTTKDKIEKKLKSNGFID